MVLFRKLEFGGWPGRSSEASTVREAARTPALVEQHLPGQHFLNYMPQRQKLQLGTEKQLTKQGSEPWLGRRHLVAGTNNCGYAQQIKKPRRMATDKQRSRTQHRLCRVLVLNDGLGFQEGER